MALKREAGTPIPVDHQMIEVLKVAVGDNVRYVQQEKDGWCWAACFAMVRQYLGRPSLSQSDLATKVFGAGACADPDAPSCNRGAFPDAAANLCGLLCASAVYPFDLANIEYYLRFGPIEALFERNAGDNRHVALITHLRGDGTVRLLDPWPAYGQSFPPVVTLATGYQAGRWTRTYYQFSATQ